MTSKKEIPSEVVDHLQQSISAINSRVLPVRIALLSDSRCSQETVKDTIEALLAISREAFVALCMYNHEVATLLFERWEVGSD